MAIITPPAWQQAGSYPARNDRLALSGLLAYPGNASDEATPLRVRPGVKPSYQNYQLKVRAAGTPNMTVIVSGGLCVIDQRETGGSGAYVCANDGDVTLTVQPAGGAGQYRKDTVVASVYDAEYSGAVSEWRLEVIQGPYAASAGATVRGTLPSNAIPLADLAIAPSQSSVTNANITDVRVYTVASGGILPLTATTDMSRPHPGEVRYRTDTDTFVYGKSDGTTAVLLDSAGASTVGKSLFARKTADTNRTSTTLTADPDLSVTLLPNAVYRLEATLFVGTTDQTNGDIALQWALPGSTAASWALLGQPTTATSGTGSIVTQAVGGSQLSLGAITAADLAIISQGLIETDATGGTFALNWARSGTAGTVSLRARSHMSLTRVA